MPNAAIVLLIAFLASLAGEEGAGDKMSFSIPNHGWWRIQPLTDATVTFPPDEAPETASILFAPKVGRRWKLSLAGVPWKGGGLITDAQLRSEFVRVSRGLAMISAEKKCTAQEIAGGVGRGYFAKFTDAGLADAVTVPDGQYKYMFLAVYAIGNHILAFTFLEQDADVRNEDMFLKTITSVEQE